MNISNGTRRRAVVFSADVKDDARLLREDEAQTLNLLAAHHDLMATLIQQHHGHLRDAPGGNILAEFASAVDAVQGAVAIQKRLNARNAQLPENQKIEFHIGIHHGDVIADLNRLYGDSVRIAASLESLAEPGGICISEIVYAQIADQLSFEFQAVSLKAADNVAGWLAAYRVRVDSKETAPKPKFMATSEKLDALQQIEEFFGQAQIKRRNHLKARFNRRLRNFLIVNAILFLINLMSYHGYWWFIWPALGWGLYILMGWKRARSSFSPKTVELGNEKLLSALNPPAAGSRPKFLNIRIEPDSGEDKGQETLDIKVPLMALKAGVKLDAFLPLHAREKVNEALVEKGLDFDPASLEDSRTLVVLDALTNSDMVIAKENQKIRISCE